MDCNLTQARLWFSKLGGVLLPSRPPDCNRVKVAAKNLVWTRPYINMLPACNNHEYCHRTILYQIAALCSDGSSALKVLSTSLQKTAEIDRTNMARYFVITYTITLHLVSDTIKFFTYTIASADS